MHVHDFSSMSDADLLDRICACGPWVPEGLPRAIVARGAALMEPLCSIVADPERWNCGESVEGWAAVHAMHLLGAIGDPRAVDALLLPLTGPDVPDVYFDSGSGVLAHLGPGAIPTMVGFIRNCQNNYAVYVVFQGLVGMGRLCPEHAHVALDLGRELVGDTLRSGGSISALLATALAHIGDEDDIEALRAAYFGGRWSSYSYIDWDELMLELRTGDDLGEAARTVLDPMQFFSEANLARWRVGDPPAHGGRAKPAPARTRTVTPQGKRERQAKPGRNAPCPCGSGMKYKRCCGK